MTICALMIEETPVRLWGLSSRDRFERVLKKTGTVRWLESAADAPPEATVVVLRGDYLFDNRLIQSLVKTPEVTLWTAPPAEGGVPVAAHVPAGRLDAVQKLLVSGRNEEALADVDSRTPTTLASSYHAKLRKLDRPMLLPINSGDQAFLEQRLFDGSYKGVTDLVTKWWWPVPAKWVTKLCVMLGLRPNHVTSIGFLLAVVAGFLFAYGHFVWGLVAAWIMTFLDTVDGKLARVTINSSKFGHLFDHAIDLIHPPFWYLAWGLGLASFHPGPDWFTFEAAIWMIFAGYIAGRLTEGAFQHLLDPAGLFCWRPVDSYFRLITARRNPSLIMLTLGLLLGRPDIGLAAVAVWTVLSTLFLLYRLGYGFFVRATSGPLQSWFADIDPDAPHPSLTERIFSRRPGTR